MISSFRFSALRLFSLIIIHDTLLREQHCKNSSPRPGSWLPGRGVVWFCPIPEKRCPLYRAGKDEILFCPSFYCDIGYFLIEFYDAAVVFLLTAVRF